MIIEKIIKTSKYIAKCFANAVTCDMLVISKRKR